MGSVKELLTDAHDPVIGKDVNLLNETDAGLQMTEHQCNATMLAYAVIRNDLRNKINDVESFLQLVKKARQLKENEDN